MSGAIAILFALFWVAMIAWCILRDPEERHIWLFVLLFLNVVGAAIYFFVRVLPALGLYDRLVLAGRRRREMDRIEGELVHLDRPHLWARLGRLRLESGDLDEADEALRKALAREDDADYRFDLGRALAARGRREDAARELAAVVARDPDHAYGDAKRFLARTLVELGRDAEARPLLEELARTRPSAEVRYHLAVVLERAGNRDAAREQCEHVERESESLPAFSRHAAAPWKRRAAAMRKRLG